MSYFLLLLTYTFGRVFFCVIHHQNSTLRLYEYIFSILFFVAAVLWRQFFGTSYDGLVVAFLFIGTGMLPRRLAKDTPGPWIGIIDFVWIVILGLACGGIVFASNFHALQMDAIPPGLKAEYYKQYASELSFLLGKSVDLLMILGSILAVAMSIVWGGEIWRRRDTNSEEDYRSTARKAIAMAFAYFVVFITVAFWVCLPLYKNYAAIKDFLG